MSETILNHFLCGPTEDDNTHLDFLIDGQRYHLPIEKMYDFWKDYLSLDHNLVIEEVPSYYTTIIIDFWTFFELDNVTISETCGKIVEEIKEILKCITFEFKCYIFKCTKNTKKLRFVFPHFFMEKSVINTILIKNLDKKFMTKSNGNITEKISIPCSIEFFDEINGYTLYGMVNNLKFKTVTNLSFEFINKGIKNGIIYNTYKLLSQKYTNEKLYPIIFSINNQKHIAASKYPLKLSEPYSLELCKTNSLNQLNYVHIENAPVLRECLSKSLNNNTSVPTSFLLKYVNGVEEVNYLNQKMQKYSPNTNIYNLLPENYSRPIFLKYNQNIFINNYCDNGTTNISDLKSKK